MTLTPDTNRIRACIRACPLSRAVLPVRDEPVSRKGKTAALPQIDLTKQQHERRNTMQCFKREKITGLLAVLVMFVAGASTALAQGTASNTTISNTATVNYDVGTVAQTPIESSPTGNSVPGVGNGTSTDFVVDNRVDLLVANTAGASVTPNDSTLVAITFTLTNDGNTTQNYVLTTTQDAGDDFDMQNGAIYIDANGNGVFDSGTDTLYSGSTGDIAPDGTITVFLVGNTTGITPTNNQVANVTLTATTQDAGTTNPTSETGDATAWNPATVQVVFGDSAGVSDAAEDGVHSDTGTFTVATSDLTVSKTQTVTADPFSASNPKAIPGATIQYTVVVANAVGGSAAENVVISDVIPAGLTYNTNSVAVDFGGGAVPYADGGGVAAFAGGTLTVDISAAATAQSIAGAPDLAANTTATVTYDVTVTYP